MKPLIPLLACLLLLAPAAPVAQARVPRRPFPLVEPEQQFTSQTLLVSVDRKWTKKELRQVLAKYQLTVVYDYKNFNMYALAPKKPCTEFRLQRIRKHLQQEPHVVGVERDRVMQLEEGRVGDPPVFVHRLYDI